MIASGGRQQLMSFHREGSSTQQPAAHIADVVTGTYLLIILYYTLLFIYSLLRPQYAHHPAKGAPDMSDRVLWDRHSLDALWVDVNQAHGGLTKRLPVGHSSSSSRNKSRISSSSSTVASNTCVLSAVTTCICRSGARRADLLSLTRRLQRL